MDYLFKMEGSKEIFAEQRLWEDNQDPRLLGDLIKQYLTERNYGNQVNQSKDKEFQKHKRF